jgi:tetratricopeptide (TPR) repeat protein
MRQTAVAGLACLCALIATGAARSAPQEEPQNEPNASAERAAYQAARNEGDAQTKIKLLDDFVEKYPDSPLMPDAYRDYYQAYFAAENYPKTIEFADRFVDLRDKLDADSRMMALVTREVAYFAACNDSALRTPEAYTKARDAGRQGLELLGQWQKPENVSGEQFDAEKKSFEIILTGVTTMAESGLEGRQVSCLAPKTPPGSPQAPNDGRIFDRMIKDIQEQQRQSPRVK